MHFNKDSRLVCTATDCMVYHPRSFHDLDDDWGSGPHGKSQSYKFH